MANEQQIATEGSVNGVLAAFIRMMAGEHPDYDVTPYPDSRKAAGLMREELAGMAAFVEGFLTADGPGGAASEAQ